MKFVLFIHSKDESEVASVAKTVQLAGQATHWQSVLTQQAVSEETNTSWNEGISNLAEQISAKQSVQDELTSLTVVASQVYTLADQLPAFGTVVDVYMWPPKPDSSNNNEYIALLGSLKRLKEWHNAEFHIFDAAPTADSEFLQRFLSADFHISAESYSCFDDGLLWRGKVSICDKIENKGVVIPGVSFHQTDNSHEQLRYPVQDPSTLNVVQLDDRGLIGRMFEVLDEVELLSIPTFLRTPHVFKLCLYQKHAYSQVLMNYVQQNSETGLLARLAVYPNSDSVPTCEDVGLSARAWKENIIADIQFVQEPEEDLQDNYEFLYFVITAPSKDSSAGSFVASAHLLQHPYSVNGSLASVFYHNALVASNMGDNSDVELLDVDGLPCLTVDLLNEVKNDLAFLQHKMLSQLAAERREAGLSQEIPWEEVTAYLKNVHLKYCERLADNVPKFKSLSAEKIIDLTKAVTEMVANGNEWPERLIQQYQECQKRSLSRLQSCESMLLSSPLQPTESSTTVDIQTLLKCFLPDGSATADNLSPIRRRHSGRTQSCRTFTENSPQHILWPESKNISSHDVYYNSDNRTEKMNNHLNKMRDKYVKEETYSSCLATNVVFPKGDKHKKGENFPKGEKHKKGDNPEPRRSPRKRTACGVLDELNTSSIEEKRKKRVSLAGRLSDSLTPLATIKERQSERRFSTPHPPPPSRDKRRVSSISSQNDRRLSDVSMTTSTPEADATRMDRRDSLDDSISSQSDRKESRSERHKRKLQEIVENVLIENGVLRTDPIFSSCSSRLFKITKLFVMDLPSSRNLKTEMKKIAASQVKQVIEVGRSRQQSSHESRRKASK